MRFAPITLALLSTLTLTLVIAPPPNGPASEYLRATKVTTKDDWDIDRDPKFALHRHVQEAGRHAFAAQGLQTRLLSESTPEEDKTHIRTLLDANNRFMEHHSDRAYQAAQRTITSKAVRDPENSTDLKEVMEYHTTAANKLRKAAERDSKRAKDSQDGVSSAAKLLDARNGIRGAVISRAKSEEKKKRGEGHSLKALTAAAALEAPGQAGQAGQVGHSEAAMALVDMHSSRAGQAGQAVQAGEAAMALADLHSSPKVLGRNWGPIKKS